MDPDRLTADLDPAQQAAVTSDAAPLCILAGAGSGKTRVLTRRIAHRVVTGQADAAHVLALTFTRKAAGELRSRLGALGVRPPVVAGTFHAVAYAQLRRRWADRGERAPALLEGKARLLVPLIEAARGGRGRSAAVQVADVAGEIEWAKARLVPAAAYEREAAGAGRTPPLPAAVMASVYERYEADKRKRGLVDFDDLLGLCARALAADPEFAATQRWRFRHLFVDEFQDVNPVQFDLLTGWLGDRRDLCVVGDPNQAIYSWNGADPGLLAGFGQRFPGGATIRLEDNYRSTPQVLAVAGGVLAGAGAGAGGTGGLRARRPDGAVPVVRSWPSDAAEARAVAAQIRRTHGPARPWSHVAVLTRTNAQTLLFEVALGDARIPFRVRGGGGFLHQPEVKAALAELARAPAGAPFSALVTDLEAMAAGEEGTEERRLSLQSLARLARDYAALDGDPSMAGFAAWLAVTVKGEEPERGGDAVEIATFHRAKGLEWPVVHVTGLERGLVPILAGGRETAESVAEERRLLYVALTRARDELHCSWAERRSFSGRSVPRSPSPWLADIQAAVDALRGADVPAAAARVRLERERARLRSADGGARPVRPVRAGPGSDPDPAVLAALKEWRARTARAASVPAHVIFHDATLAAVAELRPASREALLAVPGMGPVKAQRYGDALLDTVARLTRAG